MDPLDINALLKKLSVFGSLDGETCANVFTDEDRRLLTMRGGD